MKKPLASIERRFLESFWFTGDYAIWSDGTVSVTGDCQLKAGGMKMDKLPIHFREVGGSFKADGVGLKSLEGLVRVGGDCICPNNPLVSLGTSKLSIGGDLYVQGEDIGETFWKEFKNAASVANGIFCSVSELKFIDDIAGIADKEGQEKFFVSYKKDLGVGRCTNGRIALLGAPPKIDQIIKDFIERNGFGHRANIFACFVIQGTVYRQNGTW